MDWEDRTTCVLFGDGAGALLLEAQDGDGSNADRGILSTRSQFRRALSATFFMSMAGSASTTGHSCGCRARRSSATRSKNWRKPRRNRDGKDRPVERRDVDWIVPHQANLRIIQGTAKKMGMSMDHVVVTVQDHGNTSAASIPLALSDRQGARGQIKEGDVIVTEAIGGGLAWGAVVLRW